MRIIIPAKVSRVVDRQVIQDLSVPSNWRAMCDLLQVWGVIWAAVAAAHLVDRWYVYAIAVVVIGARQNALATLAHEGWHGLLFSSRRLNHLMGAWLYSYPIGILYNHDRDRHLRHHREVGHDYDPDWVNYTSQRRKSRGRVLAYLASLLFGRLLFSSVLSFIMRGRPRIASATFDGAGVRRELLYAVICQGALFAVMTLATGRWWSYPLLWMLPLATFAGFFANFRALIEHISVRDDVSPEDRLRDIQSGLIERFFISPSHFNYHALHHAHPSIPHYNLARGKKAYVSQLGSYPFVVWTGYTSALLSHLRRLNTQA